MAWEVTASPVRFDEAIDWFRAKAGNAVTREQWDALGARAKRRSGMVSGFTRLDIVQRVLDQLAQAIENGTPLNDFKKAVAKDLADTWLSEDSARLEVIYRNNVQSAFAAGRYLQATTPDALEQHPVWMLDVVMDSRTSDVCEPLDGVKRRADDPWWQGRIPPLHHKCRTGLLTLTEEDAHEMGGLTEPAPETRAQENWGARPELDEWKGDPTSYAPELQSEARRIVEEARSVGSPLASPTMPTGAPKPQREREVTVSPPSSEEPDEGPVRAREAEPYPGYQIPPSPTKPPTAEPASPSAGGGAPPPAAPPPAAPPGGDDDDGAGRRKPPPPWHAHGEKQSSGKLNEDARKLPADERRIADKLLEEGNDVTSRSEKHKHSGTGRKFDVYVNEEPTEFKSPTVPTVSAIVNALRGAVKGGAQAPNIIVDVRGSSLAESDAEAAIAKARPLLKGRLAHVRIIGDTFDRTFSGPELLP